MAPSSTTRLAAFFPCAAALTATWQSVPGSVTPPRSGPTASTDGKSSWLFGGYAEADGERAVVNDLLRFESSEAGWTRQQKSSDSTDVPGPRLATASAVLDGEMLLFGGWDPQVAGTGGAILDDVWALDLATQKWSRCEAPMPGGPTSRHVAVNVGGTLVVHTFRCTDAVLVWDAERRALREQPTTGAAPSSRGLHVGAAADERTLVVFGGAAKDGGMVNDAFALDVLTWEWRRLGGDEEQPRPSARAGACAAPLPGGGGIVVCCGTEASETGLLPRADAWALTLDGGGVWTRLLDDDAPTAPAPRNAATLTPLGDGRGLLLHGGWRPFVSTYGDSHVLTVEA